METITVFPASTQHKARVPDGIEVEAAVAKQLGLKDGDKVTKDQIQKIVVATMNSSRAVLEDIGERQRLRMQSRQPTDHKRRIDLEVRAPRGIR